MKTKAFAVIDTNVIVSGILSDGFPENVLELIDSQNIIPIFDNRMLIEYHDVLSRQKFHIPQETVYDTLYRMVNNGIMINDIEQTKIELRDRKDIPFFEVKENSSEFAPYLVTGNQKHFPVSPTTVNPREMLDIMEKLEWWTTIGLKDDVDYENVINEFKNKQLATSKYTAGKDIINDLFDTKCKSINSSSRLLQLNAVVSDKTFAPSENTESLETLKF